MRTIAAIGLVVSSVLFLAVVAPRAARRQASGAPPVRRAPIETSPLLPDDAPATEEDYVERFDVAKDGEWLIVPVEVDGAQYPFVVDTGCSRTVLDESFPSILEPADGAALDEARSPRIYHPHEINVGRSRLPVRGNVERCNLSVLQHSAGREIRGILGMTFLGLHVVVIDFDEGTLTLRKRSPQTHGTLLRLSESGDRRPMIDARAGPDARDVSFLVDTGWCHDSAGCFEVDLFDGLARCNALRPTGTTCLFGINGIHEAKMGTASYFRVGNDIHEQLDFVRGDLNIIGLPLLSRYVVTFDFPNGTMVLTPGRKFAGVHADELRLVDANALRSPVD